jgi:cell division protein FtsL
MADATKRVVNGTQYSELSQQQIKTKPAVKKKVKSKSSSLLIMKWVFPSVLVVFIIFMAYIFVEASITRLNWEIHQQIEMNEKQLMDNEKIRLEIAKKKSLDRIEDLASRELGMVKAANIDFMIVSENMVPQGVLKADAGETFEDVSEQQSWIKEIIDFLIFWKDH